MLVVMVQYVGHEGGVVGQPLAHAQGDGLTGEQTVAPCCRIHGDGNARRQHGHGQHPQEIHDWSVQQERGGGKTPRGRLVRMRGWLGQRNPTRPWLKLAAPITVEGGGDSGQRHQ